MSNWPFRFVHASDFHLELPPGGVAEVPDHLRDLFLESTYWAAEKVFETARSEEADFLILSGDILDPTRTGPRGPLFLVEQFEKLAERKIPVYWAGGRVDPPSAWPSAVRLPENVHVFPTGRADELIHRRDETPRARLIGASRGRGRSIRAAHFDAPNDGLFSIAVAHGSADAETLQGHGIDYWALGGRHTRQTLFSSPRAAHFPGSPQGRRPEESGPYGCALVEVDGERKSRITQVPTALMRWCSERLVVGPSDTRADLETMLHQQMQAVRQSIPETDLMITWTVGGSGPLIALLRKGNLAGELREALRAEHGSGPPAAWSVSLGAEPAEVLPPEWYEQQTIRGEFLRAIRHYQMNPSEAIDLEPYLSEGQLAGSLGAAVAISGPRTRDRVLAEAAMLGVDLLSGEEPQS
jgi:hypothetical protein